MSPRRTRILLLLLLFLATATASKQRRRQRRSRDAALRVQQQQKGGEDWLDSTFPTHLRSGFPACNAKRNADDGDGELGLCKLLAALDTQLELLGAANSSSRRRPPDDSCRYRSDGGDRLHSLASSPSPHFVGLLGRYQRLHEACTAVEHSRVAPDATGQLRCRYVVWRCTYGLGNRIMSLVSSFLYALLTQRVLLLDTGPTWDGLFCPAFPGSPWRLAQGITFKDHPCTSFSSFIKHRAPKTPRPAVVAVDLDHHATAVEHGFLACPSSMAAVRDVPIVFLRDSNQYFAPGFFLNPSLRPVLETIFPDRRVFHTIARSLLFPSNEVWTSIAAVHRRHLQPASRRLGVQLREFKGEYRDFYDASVPRCIRRRLCPIEIDEFRRLTRTGGVVVNDDDGFFSVYVASLAGGHALSINGSLTTMEAETGQKFKVVTSGSEGQQKEGLVHLQRALVDMWSLSLSETLLTSPMSTFGYVAQGLAGVTPLRLIRHWKNDPCLPSVSSDPCYHFAPARNGSVLDLACVKHDTDGSVENTDPRSFSVEVPEVVKACPDMPRTGMQLSEPW